MNVGHRVRVLADPAVAEEARAAGCGFSAFRLAPHHNLRSRKDDIFRDWEQRTRLGQIEQLFETVSFAPAQRYAQDVLDELMREPADVVVVDSMLFGAQIGAEASGLPTAVLWHMPFTLGEGVPPPGLGLRPARTGLGRVRDRALRALTRRFTDAKGLSVLNQAREAMGLAPLESVDRQLLRADRARVEVSGVGIRLKRTAGTRAVGRSVQQVLARPSYTEAARRMAKTIRDEIGAQAARHELEALASPVAGPSMSDARHGTVSAEG